ncbi:MAG: hypothetical protein NVS2B12_02590 [Ktedonobacteraceae bacterium]
MGKHLEQQPDDSTLDEIIGRTQPHPLIGREQEVSCLQHALLETERQTQAWAQPIAGGIPEPQSWVIPSRAPFYLLCGDMGIGKTRLAEETGRLAHQRGWSILWGRAYVQERAPYQLWVDILRQATKHDLWQAVARRLSPTQSHFLAALLPELAHLLPPPHAAETASTARPEQLWEAMLMILLAVGEHGPVLLVVDDLQWADNSSSEFLAYLCRHLVDLPFLLLGTCRNNKLPAEHALHTQLLQLQRARLVASLCLAPLSNSQIATFVIGAPDQTVQHIQYLAAGNPFFAEELARAVNSKKEVQKRERETEQWTLPQTLSDLLEQRLERLSKGCVQLLRAAAVLGVSFSLHTIALMQTKTGSTPNTEGILTLLEEAQQAELLTEQGSGAHIAYHFWHPLLMHHLYESTSAARRVLLHRRAGHILQEIYTSHEDEGATLIMHHLIQSGGEAAQIAHYAELAGRRAYMLSAYSDAESYYRQAIRYHTEHLQKRLQIAGTEHLHIASLQEYLAECLRVLNRPVEACETYEQIQAIYNQYGQYSQQHADIVSSTTTSHLNVQWQALLRFHIARTWYMRGDIERTLLYCSQAEDMLNAVGITGGGAWAYIFLQESYAYWRKGLYAQASKLAQQACILFEEILADGEPVENATPIKRMLMGDRVGLAHAYCHFAAINNSSGQYTEALIYLNKALMIYQQQSCKRNVAIVCNDMGDIYLRLTDFAGAQAFFARGLQDAKYVGDALLVAYIIGNSGILTMRCGQLASAEDHFRRAITQFEQCNEAMGKILFSPYLAILLAEQDRISEAQEIMCAALTMARRLHLVPYIGYVLVMVGNIRLIQALTTADHDRAQRSFFNTASTQLLKRARRTLERALTFEGLDAEIHLTGCLILLEVCWLLDQDGQIYEQVTSLRTKSEQCGLGWLLPAIERLQGNILLARDSDQATLHFEQSLHYARRYDLRWEYGRTLHSYGGDLLKQQAQASHSQGVAYLQEAREVFAGCQALRDLHDVEKLLASSLSPVKL